MPIFVCPHCEMSILIEKEDYNCCIFRHGVYKNTYNQMNPHESKENCEKLVDEIIGCGKPFRIDRETDKILVCDYI
jgi:hypothetical protein